MLFDRIDEALVQRRANLAIRICFPGEEASLQMLATNLGMSLTCLLSDRYYAVFSSKHPEAWRECVSMLEFQQMDNVSYAHYRRRVNLLLQSYDGEIKNNSICFDQLMHYLSRFLYENGMVSARSGLIHFDPYVQAGLLRVIPFSDVFMPINYYLFSPSAALMNEAESFTVEFIKSYFKKIEHFYIKRYKG